MRGDSNNEIKHLWAHQLFLCPQGSAGCGRSPDSRGGAGSLSGQPLVCEKTPGPTRRGEIQQRLHLITALSAERQLMHKRLRRPLHSVCFPLQNFSGIIVQGR